MSMARDITAKHIMPYNIASKSNVKKPIKIIDPSAIKVASPSIDSYIFQ